MRQISSRATWFSKYITPVFLLGCLGVFAIIVLLTNKHGGPPLVALIVPIVVGPIIFFVMKKTVWDLADEVFDAGDSLIVRFGNEQDRIPLANIVNVSYANMMKPPRVTLTLRSGGHFGSEISFAAPTVFVPFGKSPLITDLIQRVDAARMASR